MAKKRTSPSGKAAKKRVSEKISVLMHEGTPQKQAVAMGLEMERAHRLGPGGVYKRKGSKKK